MQLKRELREVIDTHHLPLKEVAELLHVSLDTVKSWLKPTSTRSSNTPPRMAIELLAIKAKARMEKVA